MNIVESFFDSVIFRRVENIDGYSIYAVRLSTHLGHDERYVVAYVPKDVSIMPSSMLKNLHWVFLRVVNIQHPKTEYIIQKQKLNLNVTNDMQLIKESDNIFLSLDRTVRVKLNSGDGEVFTSLVPVLLYLPTKYVIEAIRK